jgi:spore maturation protein SpmA
MLNYIWLALILLGVVIGGFSYRMKEVADGAISGAGSAVTLAIGLIGIMSLWLGVMRLAERAGLVQALARVLRPVLRRIFPDVPVAHPAMGSMVLNIAANMLGLSNAATPLGLRAMRDLETLNRVPGTATNAMCMFLTLNTGSVQLIPITVIAVLAANGSQNPAAIIGPALLASIFVSAIGISAVKFFERLPMFRLPEPLEPRTLRSGEGPDLAVQAAESREEASAPAAVVPPPPQEVSPLGRLALTAFALCCVWFLVLIAFPEWFGRVPLPDQAGQGPLVRSVNAISLLAIPALLAFFPLYAGLRGLAVYEEFVEGAKEGFTVAIRIIPYLVAMLVAIGMFRGGGGIDLLTRWLKPALDAVYFPTELLPLALMRSLSGSGSLGIFTDLVKTLGPDHLVTQMAATIYGSSETTFYVIAVYFGSVGVQRTRHAVPAGLVADVAGIIASIIIVRLILG